MGYDWLKFCWNLAEKLAILLVLPFLVVVDCNTLLLKKLDFGRWITQGIAWAVGIGMIVYLVSSLTCEWLVTTAISFTNVKLFQPIRLFITFSMSSGSVHFRFLACVLNSIFSAGDLLFAMVHLAIATLVLIRTWLIPITIVSVIGGLML